MAANSMTVIESLFATRPKDTLDYLSPRSFPWLAVEMNCKEDFKKLTGMLDDLDFEKETYVIVVHEISKGKI
jgi:hypothetical protein